MATSRVEIRSGAYYDSVILMQLQRSLSALPGVIDAGVVMGTEANKDILDQSGMLPKEAQSAAADDLIIVVQAHDAAAAGQALSRVDELLARRPVGTDHEYRPKSLESAAQMSPDARWVLVSVPGRYAAGVARQALQLGKNVFLYSDNVTLDDEIALKQTALDKGLLVMGPDCGTAMIGTVGLGFANRVRQGPVGIVAASGTGLQQVSARIHQRGGGLTHALGTGGRDLSDAVGAATASQGLDLLLRDDETKVIVLVSKPPSAAVAGRLLGIAGRSAKPVVVDFIGYAPPASRVGNVHFAITFESAADLAVRLAAQPLDPLPAAGLDPATFAPGQRYLRGLFSGGSLAYEALRILQYYLPVVYSNTPLGEAGRLADPLVSQGHTVVDLGDDVFTVGRLHPMMDNDLRIRRLRQEAGDPEVAVILLDVVLGYGAHPDPARELAPAIAQAREVAASAGRHLEVVAVVVGTDEDPQDLESQEEQLAGAGARVMLSNEAAAQFVGATLQALDAASANGPVREVRPVELAALQSPLSAINVGLESFAASVAEQGAAVVHVDWRPPAGGDAKLASILERLR